MVVEKLQLLHAYQCHLISYCKCLDDCLWQEYHERVFCVYFIKIAEQCNLSWLNISFCYKISQKNIEIMISLLRAKGTLHTFEAMGISVSPLAMEMIQSTRCLTTLSLCGVPALMDDKVELVRQSLALVSSYCQVVEFDDFYQILQITKALGDVLLDLDISNCLALTDQSCASIARHCVVLEVLGLKNHREMKGTDLITFFQNKERAKHFRSITMSGSKNVSSQLRSCLPRVPRS